MLADGHVTSVSTVFRALRLLRAQEGAADAGTGTADVGATAGAERRQADPTD
jgi:hypothetical protein